jgi:hypothetical protein
LITKVSLHENRREEKLRIVQFIARLAALFNLGSHLIKLIGWEVVTGTHTYMRPRGSLLTKSGTFVIQR